MAFEQMPVSLRHRLSPLAAAALGVVAAIPPLDKWRFWVIELIMDSQQDAGLTDRLSEAESVSIPKASRALGLDAYTLYTFIQRGRVQAGLSPSGEFVIPKSEVDRLALKE